jgi:hypothetical protein
VPKTRESASASWNMRAVAPEQPAPPAARKRGSLLNVVS